MKMIFLTVERLHWTLLLTTVLLFPIIRRLESSAQTSPAQLFQVQHDSLGTTLCCMDSPNAILQVRSPAECAIRCVEVSATCAHFNVKTNGNVRSCELYPSTLACYGELGGCTNYKVRDNNC